jgi:hypothetical protein
LLTQLPFDRLQRLDETTQAVLGDHDVIGTLPDESQPVFGILAELEWRQFPPERDLHGDSLFPLDSSQQRPGEYPTTSGLRQSKMLILL